MFSYDSFFLDRGNCYMDCLKGNRRGSEKIIFERRKLVKKGLPIIQLAPDHFCLWNGKALPTVRIEGNGDNHFIPSWKEK
jgi:hypothetical protein